MNCCITVRISVNNLIKTHPNYSARDSGIINFDNYVVLWLLCEAQKGAKASYQQECKQISYFHSRD